MKQWVAPSAKWRLRANAIAATHCPASAAAVLYNSRAVPVMGFVAQLAILPAEVSTAERGVVSALLHAATNTFDEAAIFNLAVAGGPAITSLKVMSLATMARTAYKTLPDWRQCCNILEQVTDDMPGVFLCTGVASPACWHSPPFAFNLRMVAEGFKSAPIVDKFMKPSHFINQSRMRLGDAAKDAARLLNRSRLPMGRKQIQKTLAIGFKEALLPPKLEALLASRFEKHFAAACSKNVVPDWKALLAFLRTCQHHYAMIALKTLLNSWCTSTRYNDNSADSCIFGCSHAKDDISHYSS